jgi:hypothetical protein
MPSPGNFMKLSLLVTTFDRPDALACVLNLGRMHPGQ